MRNRKVNFFIAPAPEGYHINPIYIEKKSKRLQCVLKPSTFEKMKAKAEREKRSVNDIVNELMEKYVSEALDKKADGKPKTATQIIEEACYEICAKYCKYTEQYGDTDEGFDKPIDERCNDCPLNRLY